MGDRHVHARRIRISRVTQRSQSQHLRLGGVAKVTSFA